MRRGKFIVIDGTDGSGKATQLARLKTALTRQGYQVKTFDFPQYGKPSSYFVQEYLNGRYGTLKENGPYRASVFYVLDRFDAASKIRSWLKAGYVVVSNRYVSANMGHQGSKIANPLARKKCFRWLHGFEYGIMGIPKPDLTLILHVPAEIAQQFVDRKASRAYIGGKKRDMHESDLRHLRRAEATYLSMARLFPKDFRLVECVKNGSLLDIPEVSTLIFREVEKELKR